jgi:hypothetical protein
MHMCELVGCVLSCWVFLLHVLFSNVFSSEVEMDTLLGRIGPRLAGWEGDADDFLEHLFTYTQDVQYCLLCL